MYREYSFPFLFVPSIFVAADEVYYASTSEKFEISLLPRQRDYRC